MHIAAAHLLVGHPNALNLAVRRHELMANPP
jgi:hypothetical protein